MQPAKSTALLKVLSVSPLEGDHSALQSIVGHSNWRLFKADRLPAALTILRDHDISVVLCECHLIPGSWTDVLDAIKDLPKPPSLIVTSRVADDRLWAEALNLGAWDVVAKPFDRGELLRSVKAAWQHWYDHTQMPIKVMRAAS